MNLRTLTNFYFILFFSFAEIYINEKKFSRQHRAVVFKEIKENKEWRAI
jgi:hypothetical protein